MAKTGLFRTVKAFSFAAAIVAAGLFASASLASCSNLGGGYGDSSDSANSSVLIVGELPAGMGRVCGKIQNKNDKSSASKTVAPDSDTLETQINHYEICAWGTPDSGSPVPESSPITGTVDSSNNFSIDLPFGTWILRADAVNADDKIILSKKSNPIPLNEDSPVISQSFRLEYYKNSDETGKLNLPIGFATGRITTISYSLSAQAATPGFPISGTVAAPAGGTFNLDGTADTAFDLLPPGTYDLVVEFLDANGIVVRLDQSVQIYSNLTTNKINGSAPYVNSSGDVNVSSDVIQEYESSSYYVGGTGASDTNAGTQYDPFLTIQKAMARIDASALASTTEFTIYLLGNANLGNNIIIDSGKKISIVGTNASAKYTVNGADSFSVTMGGSSLKCKNVIFNKVKDFAISAGQSEFANCSITNGKSSGNGGGLNVTGAGTKAILKNCVVAGCKADSFGGGIYVEGPSSGSAAQVELTDCVVGASSSSCADGTSTAYSNFAASGGGGLAIAENGKAVLTNTKVLYNATKDNAGGGIRCAFGGVLEITGGQINHNYAGYGGGGIYIYGPTTQVTIDGCAIGELTADAAPTGIANCGNYSAREGGGGILISSGVLSTTSGFSVIKNYSTAPTSVGTASGGGIATSPSSANTASLTLVNTKISYNASTSAGGGLCAKEYTKPFSVTGGEFIGNSAKNGGGLSLDTLSGDSPTLDGVLIQGNVATGNGGGIQVTNGKYLTIKGSTLISGNSADNGGGLSASGKVTFEGGTISGNTATTYGAGVYINSSTQAFTMKGNAYVADDNDVWLGKAHQNKITVGGALTSTILPVATITPEEYEADTPVLAASGLTEELCGKFALTQPAGVEFPWTIEYDSTNGGVLKHERNAIYVAAYPRGNDDSGDGTIDHPFATIKVASTKFTDPTPTGVVGYNAEFKNKIYVLTDMTYSAGLGSNVTSYYEIVGCMDGVLNDNVTFTFNTPDDSGLYVAYGQKIKLTHIDITQTSTAANHYAAILVEDTAGSELWMEDSSIKNMYANGCSAIAAKSNVHLKNVEISGNKTVPTTTGSVVFGPAINSTTGAVSILGKVTIQNNKMEVDDSGTTVYKDMNVWIGDNSAATPVFNPIVVDGLITDSKIGVTLYDNGQTFTSYFGSKAGSGADPADYFTSDEGWTVVAVGSGATTQAKLQAPTTLYVKAGGSDIIGNGTALNPYATIQRAIDRINELDNASAAYTIQVVNTLAVVQHASADSDLKATSLTIKGSSTSTPVITGGLSAQGNAILELLDVTATINIQDLDFSGARKSPAGGAAINAISCSAVNITGCKFENCVSTATTGFGGAIYWDGGTLNLSNTDITSCSAPKGGAIYVKSGKVVMDSGTISGNTATTDGGGVYVDSNGTFIMSGGTISGNTATNGAGGGICNEGITCLYDGATIGNASASGTAESATACSNKAGTNGGGIYNGKKLALGYKAWASTATAPAATDKETLTKGVYYNYAGTGGGIFNFNTGTIYIASGNVSKNLASSTSEGGGGICNYGSGAKLYVTGGTIDYNKARDGAGVYMHNSTFNLNGGTIDHNTATHDAGGVGLTGTSNSAKFTFESGTISNNTAANDAGGVGVLNGIFTMSGGSVEGNTAATHGGGVSVVSGATFTMSAGAINSNTAVQGGGIYNNGTTLIYGDAQIGASGKANKAKKDTTGGTVVGGGIYNYTSGKLGLGYNAWTGATPTAQSWTGSISYNTARDGGAGVCNAGTMYMRYGTIDHNSAPMGGGLYTATSVNMPGGTISYNQATTGGGGGVFAEGGTFTLSGGTITQNTAKTFGGGLNLMNAELSMTSGTISLNKAAMGAGVYLDNGDGTAGATVYNSTMSGGTITKNTGEAASGSSSFGGGVFIGKNTKFAMSGGSVSENTADCGGAVYISYVEDTDNPGSLVLGYLDLSADASLPGGTANKNDIQISNSITISDALTNTNVATISSVYNESGMYTAGTVVLEGAGASALPTGSNTKFSVKPDASAKSWGIDESGILVELHSGSGTIEILTADGKLTLTASPTSITTSGNKTINISYTTTPAGGTIDSWSVKAYYNGTDLIGSSTSPSYTILGSYPNGYYSLVVNVTYNGVTYSDTFTIYKNVP